MSLSLDFIKEMEKHVQQMLLVYIDIIIRSQFVCFSGRMESFQGRQPFDFCSYKSSHPRCSIKKGVLKNLTKFTGKHLSQSLFLIKLQALLKNRLWHKCFPVNFVKFSRTPFLQNKSVRLLFDSLCNSMNTLISFTTFKWPS